METSAVSIPPEIEKAKEIIFDQMGLRERDRSWAETGWDSCYPIARKHLLDELAGRGILTKDQMESFIDGK